MKLNLQKTLQKQIALLAMAPGVIFIPTYAQSAYETNKSSSLWGCVIESNAWGHYDPQNGVYTVNTSDGNMNMLATDYLMTANAGGYFGDGKFYAVNNAKVWGSVFTNASVFDTDTWTNDYDAAKGSSDMSMVATAMTYDPSSKKVYGCYYNSNGIGYVMAEADYSSFTRTPLCEVEQAPVAMAASNDGNIYVIAADGKLSTMDKTTGALSEIGSTGLSLEQKLQGCVFDSNINRIILAAEPSGASSALYSIDPESAQTTLLTNLPNDEYITILAVPEEPSEGAPATVTDLSADFFKGNTHGTVKFTIPETTYGGEALTGNVDYSICVNNIEKITGTSTPGQKIAETIEAGEGNAKITVQLSNSAGKSKKAIVALYLGFATPSYPTSVTASMDTTGEVSLSWNPSSEAMEDGYFATEDILYNVVRQPDGKVVANEITSTECTDILPSGTWTGYKYEITAVNGTKNSPAAYSRYVAIGTPLEAPYTENFDTEAGYGAFTVPGNAVHSDAMSWTYDSSSKHVLIYQDGYEDDDWLIAPPINLEANKIYTISFAVRESYSSSNYKDILEVAYGKGDNPSNYDILMPRTDINWGDYRTFSYDVTVEEAGAYRFGFHSVSEAGMPGLCIDDIAVSAPIERAAPAAVENLTVTPGNLGALSATVSFTLPSVTVEGDPLSAITSAEITRDGETIGTLTEDLQPGTTASFRDDEVSAGKHTYSVTVFNGRMSSRATEADAFIGPDAPDVVENLRFVDNYDGSVTLKWETPSVGKRGGYVSPEGLTYSLVIGNDDHNIARGVNLTDHEFTVEGIRQTGRQEFLYASIIATNNIGEGVNSEIKYPMYGAPYQLPFVETIPDGFENYTTWYSSIMNGEQFGILMIVGSDMTVSDACFRYKAALPGDYSTLSSGKISLSGANHPELKFKYGTAPGEDMKLEVLVDKATQGFESVADIDFKKLPDTGKQWEECSIDLTPFVNEPYICLNFKATMKSNMKTMLIADIAINGATGIENINNETVPGITVRPVANGVMISCAHATDVDIYNLTGMKVLGYGQFNGGFVPLASGCYIVKTGKESFKVIVR